MKLTNEIFTASTFVVLVCSLASDDRESETSWVRPLPKRTTEFRGTFNSIQSVAIPPPSDASCVCSSGVDVSFNPKLKLMETSATASAAHGGVG